MENARQYIVLFPFMAQGHFIPFLALAQLLEQKGFSIVFVSTPLNVKNLQKSLSPTSTVKFAQISYNAADHGLPPNAENTDSIPNDLIIPSSTPLLLLNSPSELYSPILSAAAESHCAWCLTSSSDGLLM
ncbi:UNVERIFIED_CONTAM: Crocetin glucosyltransferase 3 [Sesamum angustifolium]|uniref:Crocetin glucosyltransferase 3 n=1 Tax=Sesamum angustifolium TaxID=2727405 RepID=A0AAW2IYM7_9LAMI